MAVKERFLAAIPFDPMLWQVDRGVSNAHMGWHAERAHRLRIPGKPPSHCLKHVHEPSPPIPILNPEVQSAHTCLHCANAARVAHAQNPAGHAIFGMRRRARLDLIDRAGFWRLRSLPGRATTSSRSPMRARGKPLPHAPALLPHARPTYCPSTSQCLAILVAGSIANFCAFSCRQV